MNIGVKLACWLLERDNLSLEDATRLSKTILNALHATPYSAIIELDDQSNLIVNGRVLDLGQARQLRESAIAALENKALALVVEQTAFAAINHATHNAETPTQMLFARAALWLGEQQVKALKLLAGRDGISREPVPEQDL